MKKDISDIVKKEGGECPNCLCVLNTDEKRYQNLLLDSTKQAKVVYKSEIHIFCGHELLSKKKTSLHSS